VRFESRAIVAECSGKVFGIGDGAEKNGRGKKRASLYPRLYKKLRGEVEQTGGRALR
jgi:hypothetical protein